MELLAPEKLRAVRMIREELCCKLCGRVFEDPHCLDCKHNFCRECIFLHLRKSESACPKCKLPTRPSEITKNQFLQSILSAWKAVETSLAPLEDPDSAAQLEQQERQQEEEELFARRRSECERLGNGTIRGPVANNKWSINTLALKQEADAAARRANAIEMFGGSLVQRAALKNAAIDAKNNAAAEATTRATATASANASASMATAKATPARMIKPNGFGAAHFNKVMNGGATSTVNTTHQSATQDDASQTQMPVDSNPLTSPPPVRRVRRQSPFSPSEMPSPSGTSLSSLSSPFSMMATQDVHGAMQKIQAQNHFLDEWAKKNQSNKNMSVTVTPRPATGFGAKPVSSSSHGATRSVPTISAAQRVRDMMAGTAASLTTAKRSSPGKRKRQIFHTTARDSDSEEEEDGENDGHTQTHMTNTMTDSPDLLGFGGVAPPVGVHSLARRQSLLAPRLSPTTSAAPSRLNGARDDSSDEDENDQDETWVARPSTHRHAAIKAEPSTPQQASRRQFVVESSQAPREVVDMTREDDDDAEVEEDEEEEVVEDSQMPSALGPQPLKKMRVSQDFQAAISAFQQGGGGPAIGHRHRLSGANEADVESPPSRPVPPPSAPVPPTSIGVSTEIVTSTAVDSTPASSTSSVRPTPAPASVSARPPLAASTCTSSSSSITNGVKSRSTRLPPSSVHYAFVGTDLSKDECKTVILACSRLGGRFGRDFDIKREPSGALTTSVTHLITQSVPMGDGDGDGDGGSEKLGLRCKRTAKYMRALAEGTYVVDYSWVHASLTHGAWLPETAFEMSGDIYSDAVGKPRESRLRRIRTGNRNDIFRSFQFVLLCPESEFDFHLDSLRAIVVNFGARVELAHTGNRLPETQRGKTNLGIVSKVMEPLEARRLWDLYQIPIVRVTWIFDSISHLEVLPFDDYYPY